MSTEKYTELISSGQLENITLAFALAKGQGELDSLLELYRPTFDMLMSLKQNNIEITVFGEQAVMEIVNLKHLNCYGNSLTELDLSKLVNLKYLYCNNNRPNFKLIQNKTQNFRK